jgi:predicted nucleotidyltransferase
MDLTNPLRSLTPTLEAEVLAVLAGTTDGITGNRLAGLATRGSRQGLMNALDRLAAHGLVTAEHVGAATVYQLNRRHLLCAAVLSALSSRTRLAEMLRSQITTWPTSCVHSSLFGSVSRGEAHPTSDIDLLIVRRDDVDPDDDEWQRELRGLEREVRAWTGNQLAILEMSARDLSRAAHKGEPIVDSLRRDALAITGSSLDELLEA